jgi:hypothetical protein
MFSDLEIQAQSTVEKSKECAEPGLSVKRSTTMLLKSTEVLLTY